MHVIKAVIIEFKDQLARLGVESIRELLHSFGTELVLVNRVESDYKPEMIEDRIATIVHFSRRLDGKCRGRKKRAQMKHLLTHPEKEALG